MIYSLRKRHRQAMLVLAIVLPGVVVLGLMARRSFPSVSYLPEEPSQSEIRARLETLSDLGLRVLFEKSSSGKERGTLYVAPAREIIEPDTLFYWDEHGTLNGPLSERAVLLGSLKGSQLRRMIVPASVPESSGFLLLYSNAHRQVLAASPWNRVARGGAQ